MATSHRNNNISNTTSTQHDGNNLMETDRLTIKDTTYVKINGRWYEEVTLELPVPEVKPLDERMQDILNELARMPNNA